MKTLELLIVEDEVIIADNLRFMLEDLGYSVFDPVDTKAKAIEAIKKNKPDLVILDISLKGKPEGIEIGQYIKDEVNIPFIYLTSNADKATIDAAKQTNPSSYLIKPFNEDDIYAAIEVAFNGFHYQQEREKDSKKLAVLEETFFIKVGNKYIKVHIQDITHFEASGKMMDIHTVNNQKFSIRISVENLYAKLKESDFLRIHRSFCINPKHLTAINSDYVIVNNLVQIPIGRLYREELLGRINTLY